MTRRCLSAIAGGLLFIELVLPRPAIAAPDNTRGMALLMAVVNADGTLARNGGATSAQHVGAGAYEVVFDRDVTECSYVASLGGSGTLTFTGEASAARRNLNANGVFVNTFASDGTLTDKPFHLIVFCPR